MSDYVGFENWLGSQFSGDEIVNALHRMGVNLEGGVTRDEVMEALEDIFDRIKEKELRRGVSEQRAENITRYLKKVLNPGSKSVTRRTKLRQIEVEVPIITHEGTVQTRKLDDIINAERIVRREIAKEEREKRREALELVPFLVGKSDDEIEQELNVRGLPTKLMSEVKQALSSFERDVEQRKYQAYIRKINEADTREELEKIKGQATRDYKHNPKLLASVIRLYGDKRKELAKTRLQKSVLEQISLAEETLTKRGTEELYRNLLRKFEEFSKRLYGDVGDPSKMPVKQLRVVMPKEYVDWFRQEWGRRHERKKKVSSGNELSEFEEEVL